jgi:hypothetical protein
MPAIHRDQSEGCDAPMFRDVQTSFMYMPTPPYSPFAPSIGLNVSPPSTKIRVRRDSGRGSPAVCRFSNTARAWPQRPVHGVLEDVAAFWALRPPNCAQLAVSRGKGREGARTVQSCFEAQREDKGTNHGVRWGQGWGRGGVLMGRKPGRLRERQPASQRCQPLH